MPTLNYDTDEVLENNPLNEILLSENYFPHYFSQ
jgi:hypothetical protein